VPVHRQGSNRPPAIACERAITDDNLRRQIAWLLKPGCPHTMLMPDGSQLLRLGVYTEFKKE